MSLIGCNSKDKNVVDNRIDYFYVKYNLDCSTELYLDTVKIYQYDCFKDSIYTLNYIYIEESKGDTITYKLSESESSNPEYLINGKINKHDEFIYVSRESYNIKGIEFKVYKYARNPFVIDGCVTHFWTPKIGIIITRSSTWRNYRKLQTNNDSINNYIDLLTEMIYQDVEFYKGCNEEFELIPKSDAREFYEWKLKDIEINKNGM